LGWDINLADEHGTVKVAPHQEGSIIAVGGLDLADMTVTYNYRQFYYETLDEAKGFEWLDGKQAKDAIPRLEKAIAILGTERDPNYWKATAGNAGHILSVLLEWARQHPNGVFSVT
jgi:hypothetical protein